MPGMHDERGAPSPIPWWLGWGLAILAVALLSGAIWLGALVGDVMLGRH